MRSPVIAFGIFAAAVSPTLVAAAPAPKSPNPANGLDIGSAAHMMPRQLGGIPGIPALAPSAPKNKHKTSEHKKSKGKRAWDWGTAGGNAYTGASGNADGGTIINNANGAVDGMGGGTVANAAGTNMAGMAAGSTSGNAAGGNGGGFGPGGNAYTGHAGTSRGGNVINHGDAVANTDANTGGAGDLSMSGNAVGGDADDDDDLDDLDDGDDVDLRKRSWDWDTAGGNAYSGSTSSASGGTIINEADEANGVVNTGGNAAGAAGMSESGTAQGGSGDGHGPGGNAYTGATGKAHGGDIINTGGAVDNEVDVASVTAANQAGDGDTSTSGDATGGNANSDDLFDDEDEDDDFDDL